MTTHITTPFQNAFEQGRHAADEGFDWEHPSHALDKVEEEFFEVKEANPPT